MKRIMLMLILAAAMLFSAAKLNIEQRDRKIIMTDEEGYPLEDGFYNVTFRIYDSVRDGSLLAEKTEIVESKDGVCKMCEGVIAPDLHAKGYKEVWITMKIEEFPETKHRIRIFLDPLK